MVGHRRFLWANSGLITLSNFWGPPQITSFIVCGRNHGYSKADPTGSASKAINSLILRSFSKETTFASISACRC